MMKKFVATLVMATVLTANAGVMAAQISANDTGVTVSTDENISAKLWFANYDADGRFERVSSKVINAEGGDTVYTYDELGAFGVTNNSKAMLWKTEGIEPIADTSQTVMSEMHSLVAVVDVCEVYGDTARIYFDYVSSDITYDLSVDESSGKAYSFSLNGNKIPGSEIVAGDVLTIRYDSPNFEDSTFYDVTVTRKTVSGYVTGYDSSSKVYTLEGGSEYEKGSTLFGKLSIGTDYLLHLDAYGKIAYAEEIVDYGNVGVIEDVIELDTGYKVRIFKSVGGADSFEIDEETYNELYNMVYIDDTEKYGLYRRVISYDITDSGEFKLRERLKSSGGEVITYSPEAGLFDDVKVIMDDFNDDLSTIIYEEELIEGKKYKIWYFGENAGNTYELAIVKAVQEIENTTPMAVYVSRTTEDTLEGTYDVINAYVDGELKELFVDTEFDFEPGDVFFFLKDADGLVTTIEPILKESVPTTYTELYNKVLDSNFDMLNADVVRAFENASTDAFNDDTLVFGAIVDCVGNNVYVATKDTVTDVEAIDIDRNTEEYYIADDVNVYVYDYDYSALHLKNRISTSSKALFNYTLPGSAFADDYKEILNLRSETLLSENNADYGKIRFAVLKVVDDEVTEALVFRPSSSKE